MAAEASLAPRVLKLAGHDVRWQLITALAESDQRVNELISAVGQPQNLVSYHLRLLRNGELVTERRSSADARDVYYHLELDRLNQQLADSAVSVHQHVGRPLSRSAARRRPRVLFICTGNSARSQIAEAILRNELRSNVDVQSAGPAPTTVHPLALQVLRERGISVKGLRSKGLAEVRRTDFDIVITLCDKAREACAPDDYGERIVHWSLADPAEVAGSIAQRRQAFRATADAIAGRIRQLVGDFYREMEA